MMLLLALCDGCDGDGPMGGYAGVLWGARPLPPPGKGEGHIGLHGGLEAGHLGRHRGPGMPGDHAGIVLSR